MLLQPNIDPYDEKYERENAYYFDLMASMTKEQITNQTRYIITPETYFGEGLGASIDEFTSTPLHHKLDIEASTRISLSFLNTIEECRTFLDVLDNTVRYFDEE